MAKIFASEREMADGLLESSDLKNLCLPVSSFSSSFIGAKIPRHRIKKVGGREDLTVRAIARFVERFHSDKHFQSVRMQKEVFLG